MHEKWYKCVTACKTWIRIQMTGYMIFEWIRALFHFSAWRNIGKAWKHLDFGFIYKEHGNTHYKIKMMPFSNA